MEDLKEKGLKIYNVIFEGKKNVEIDDIEYPIKKFSSGVKYVDLFGYRYIEQNRNKKSEWGKKAREGDIEKSQADISLAKKLLAWEPKITLEEGLKKIFPKIES